ncbi:MAG TPA: sodium/proton-translocating pyrophosphatase, partial [Candidatus Krumholzibacteriaceae bacterium]|nr:sodium/proton-translocating pyrophosphatase [Candidatus Krumholzibacteriaceae bacterium]
MDSQSFAILTKIIPVIGGLGIIMALATYFNVRKKPAGNELMQKIADKIHNGAFVFLKREYQIIALFIILVFALLSWLLS